VTSALLRGFRDELTKLAVLSSGQQKGMAGLPRPPFPTKQTLKPMEKQINRLNQPTPLGRPQ
jgi:hypothetical protein